MPVITPVLHFKGKCAEALELYKNAFQAKVTVCLRYSDADNRDYDRPLTELQKQMVYHSEMMIGSQRIMLADEFDYDIKQGESEFLTVTFDTAEEVRNAFAVLEEGSTVIYPLHSTTYNSCTASMIDKFGFRWGLMTETA